MTAETAKPCERLLEAANELFYEDGIHAVGIDRIIERADVAKATLYSSFGNKDGLIKAYLLSRHERTQQRLEHELATRYDSARERLVGVFEILGEIFAEPGFRGCAFIGANSEAVPGPSVEETTRAFRGWLHKLFFDLATEAHARDPLALSRQLVVLYDGAGVTAWMDRDAGAAESSRAMAALLIETELPTV
jgi:AcrR family transcriptional regulator